MSEKRRQLERAATAAVQRSGLSNLSFRTLADEVGIKSSSVHYHFPEKSHLAAAVIAQYSEEFATQLGAIEANETTLAGRLNAFIDIFANVLAEGKFCLCGMLAAEVDTLNEANRLALAQYFRQMEDWLTQQLSAADAKLSSALAPAVIAQLIVGGLEGAMLLDRIDNKTSRLQAHRTLIAEWVGSPTTSNRET